MGIVYLSTMQPCHYQGQKRSDGGFRGSHELLEGYPPVVGKARDVLLDDGDRGCVLALEQHLVLAELDHSDCAGEGVPEEVPLLSGALVQAGRYVGEDGLDPFM